jgi:hypothetical protein
MYSFYIDAVAIHNQDRGANIKEETEDAKDTSLPSTKEIINFSMKDYEAISVRNRDHCSLLRELLLYAKLKLLFLENPRRAQSIRIFGCLLVSLNFQP